MMKTKMMKTNEKKTDKKPKNKTIDLNKTPTTLIKLFTTITEKMFPRSSPGFFFSDSLLHGEKKVRNKSPIEKKSSTRNKNFLDKFSRLKTARE